MVNIDMQHTIIWFYLFLVIIHKVWSTMQHSQHYYEPLHYPKIVVVFFFENSSETWWPSLWKIRIIPVKPSSLLCNIVNITMPNLLNGYLINASFTSWRATKGEKLWWKKVQRFADILAEGQSYFLVEPDFFSFRCFINFYCSWRR